MGTSDSSSPTVSLVTGANSGIGRATALKLAAEGHRVFAGMRSLDKGAKLLELGAGLDITPVVVDVADDASVTACAEEVLGAAGRLDVLVNNAGIGFNAVTEDIDIDAAKDCFDVNVWGAVRCVKAFGPGMRERRTGHIVNISSIAGTMGLIAQPVYVGSKFALEGMSECLAQEMAPFGVRVSVIEPGVTRTAILPKNEGHPEPTDHSHAYERMFEFYAAGVGANVQADLVADTVHDALTAEHTQLRWVCAWGGEELVSGRPAMSDQQWVDLGAAATDQGGYAELYQQAFGLDLSPQ
jgi:NAD(P)-dependent dehydrogenase (short-subunit alcohol dehydrogenase family)